MPFNTALLAFTVLCKPRSRGTWHIFHSQKIHWRFSGWIIQKSSSQMFPTNTYLCITGQSSRDIKHSHHPWEDTAWEGSGQSAQPCGWTPDWRRWSSSQQTGGILHPRWATPPPGCDLFVCSVTLQWSSSTTSHSYCISAMQGDSWKPVLPSQAPKQAGIFVQVFLTLVLVQWQRECSYMGFQCKSRVAPLSSTNWMGDCTRAPRQTLESRKVRVAICKKRTALVALLSNFFSWASPIGTLRGANPDQSNSCPL